MEETGGIVSPGVRGVHATLYLLSLPYDAVLPAVWKGQLEKEGRNKVMISVRASNHQVENQGYM